MIPDLELLPLFSDVDVEYLVLLKPLFERVSFCAGTKVVEQGNTAEYLYFVESGVLQISYKPYDGEPITVAHLKTGGLFGWSAVVGSPNYTSSGVVIEDLDAIRVKGSDLRKLCVEHPDAGKVILDKLADAVSNRWKDAHEQVKTILKNGMKG